MLEQSSHSVEVKIQGRSFVLKSDRGESTELRRIAGYVDQVMDTTKQASGRSDFVLGVLTSLNIAEEYWLKNRRQKESMMTLRRRIEQLIDQIDQEIGYLGK